MCMYVCGERWRCVVVHEVHICGCVLVCGMLVCVCECV